MRFTRMLPCFPVIFFLFLVGTSTSRQARPLQNPAGPQPASPSTSLPISSAPGNAARRKITGYTLPPDLYRKARNRSRIRFVSLLVGFAYGLLVLGLFLERRWSARFRDWAEKASRRRVVQALIFTTLSALAYGVLTLPLDLFDQWILKLYRISVQTWPSWLGDWAKAQFLLIVFGSLLVWLLYALIRKSPRRWWLYSWFLSLPIMVFVVFISPYLIEPIFYSFEPLASKAPQLTELLGRVSARAGQEVPPQRMFWMQASNKTIATNAYVTGLGASKRIVIWDTTIAQETTEEVLTDFGHEMGHYVLGHIWKGMAFFAAMLLALLYLGFRTIGWLLTRFMERWEIRGLDDWASLPALVLLTTVLGFPANVAGSAFSRFIENQADVYGLEVTHGIVSDPGQACARSFQNYGESVLVDPDPNPIQVFLFFDHPPVRDRVHLCVTYDPWSKGEAPQFVK